MVADALGGLQVVELQRAMEASGASLQIVTALDEIAWLLNVRGSDIEFNPVVISYATLDAQGSLRWYIDRAKVCSALPQPTLCRVAVVCAWGYTLWAASGGPAVCW